MKKRMKKQTSTVKPMSRCCLFLTRNSCGKLTAELLALGDLLAGHALSDFGPYGFGFVISLRGGKIEPGIALNIVFGYTPADDVHAP